MGYKPSKDLHSTIEVLVSGICKTHGDEASWKRLWMCLGMMIGEAQGDVIRGLQPDLAIEGELATVEGRKLFGTAKEHIDACLTQITGEQRKPEVDNSLIAVLSNSVRLTREFLDLLESVAARIPAEVLVERLENIHTRMTNFRSADTEVRDLIRALKKEIDERKVQNG